MGYSSPETQRAWRRKNPEKVAEYNRRSREKHGNEYFREAIKKWRKANPEKAKEYWRLDKQKRRARINGARTEKYIRVSSISNWETRICGICCEYIEGSYHIDHITPLSKGGEHSLANLQLAHPFCNRSKFNHLPDEPLVVL